MTARNPLWTQAGSTSAEEDRALLVASFPNPGVVTPSDLAVTQNGTPNMSVNVAAGRVAVTGTENALQGRYFGWLDATQNVVISASDPSNPRIDLIVARFKDAGYSGASNTFTVEAVTGTPAGSPVAPATPANSFILAQIAVGAAVTSIVTGNITDKRYGTGGNLPVVTSASFYPTPPFTGIGVYRRTNDANEGVEFWNSAAAAWRKPWNMPWGVIGTPAAITSSQGSITAVTDITSLSVAFTAVANRLYRVTLDAQSVQSTVTTDRVDVILADVSNNVLLTHNYPVSQPCGVSLVKTLSGVSAGSYTVKARCQRGAGTGTVQWNAAATAPSLLLVEDIGPNGAPS